MRTGMSLASKTPIYDYPNHATLTRTTWFDQWTLAIQPSFNSRVKAAMKRVNMRNNILELLHEAKQVFIYLYFILNLSCILILYQYSWINRRKLHSISKGRVA